MPNIKESVPTQKFIEIEEIKDGIVILKNSGLRRILMVGGVNFDLKSEEEQNLMTFGYQHFLNSLDFSLQTFIHSRKLNIDDYLLRIKKIEDEEVNELLKNQVSEYHEFIKNLVSQNPIMTKTFFVVVPFDPIVIPKAAGGIASGIGGIFGGNKKTQAAQNQNPIEIQKSNPQSFLQLSQRVDEVIEGLNAIGLRTVPLNTEEIIELFYNLYNPGTVEKKRLAIAEEKEQEEENKKEEEKQKEELKNK